MIPQILNIGPLPVNSFGLMIALAIFAGILCLARSFERNGIDPSLAEKYVMTAGIGGLIGARLWFVLSNYSDLKHDLTGALFASAGFTFYGGFIFGALLLIGMSRRDGVPLMRFLDSFGPGLAIGYGIGRLGCQLSGDGDYGKVTTSILGMGYPTGVLPTAPGILVYPTPLYESVITFAVLFFLLNIETRKSWQVPGRRFSVYLVFLALERFFVEFLRIEPRVAGGFTQAQVIAVVLFAAGTLLFLFPPAAHSTPASSTDSSGV